MAMNAVPRKSRYRPNLRNSKEFENMKDFFSNDQDSTRTNSCQMKSAPLEDPNFRFKLFDNIEAVQEKYPFLKARKEELNVDFWKKEQIQEAYRIPECKEQIDKQLSTVCQRSYLSNVFEEQSYLSTSYLTDLFKAVVEENDHNTDILMVMIPDGGESKSSDCGGIINISGVKQETDYTTSSKPIEDDGIVPRLSPNTPNTPKTPNLDNKVIPSDPFERLRTGAYSLGGLMISSYGYNLCGCLPLELKDKYITLDILCSKQGTKGIGGLMMSSLLLSAYERNYTMIGLQVASSTFKSLTNKRLKKGTNIEACLFYENFGFFYDNTPRDIWFCFDPESAELTTMLLDMEKYANKDEIVELCKKRLTREGSSIPEKKFVLPSPSAAANKGHIPTQWQGRRVSRKRPADYTMEAQDIKKPKREEAPYEESPKVQKKLPAKSPRVRGKQPLNRKIEAGKKVEFILQSMQQILSDGVPRSAKTLLEILRNPPYGVDFQAEKPLNTLTSILSKETIHFKKTTITRVPNSLPLLYTLKEFLGSKPKSQRKSGKPAMRMEPQHEVLPPQENSNSEAPLSNTPPSFTLPPTLSQSPNGGRNFIVPHEINIESEVTKTLENENSNGSTSGNPLTSPPLRSIEPVQYVPTSNMEFGEAPLEPLFENMETEPTPKLTNSESNTPLFRSPEEVRKIGENSPGDSRNAVLKIPSPAVLEEEIKNLPPDVCNLCREKAKEIAPHMDYRLCRGCIHKIATWGVMLTIKKNPNTKESS